MIGAGAAVVVALMAGGATVAVTLVNNDDAADAVRPPLVSLSSEAMHSASRPSPAGASPSTTITAAKSFSEIYQQVQSGVVRIETVSCDANGVGTGVLLSPTHIATAAHVVENSVVISLQAGDQQTTGTVIGMDQDHDLALVRADTPLTGYHMALSARALKMGEPVAAIGFPAGDPITLTQGHISGLDREITVEGVSRHGMVETDAAINPGNSGGPLLDETGAVIGLVDAKNTEAEGIAFAVPASQAAPTLASWRTSPQIVTPGNCSVPLGPSYATDIVPDVPATGDLTSYDAAGITSAFSTYFNGINSGDYYAAYAVLDPANHDPAGGQEFAAGVSTSYDSNITFLDARRTSTDTAQVDVIFTSIQAPEYGPDGESCTMWTLDYTVVERDGSWYLHKTTSRDGITHTPC